MAMSKHYWFILILFLLACNPKTRISNPGPSEKPPELPGSITQPKNIILMIGDGMGLGQITAGMYMNGK